MNRRARFAKRYFHLFFISLIKSQTPFFTLPNIFTFLLQKIKNSFHLYITSINSYFYLSKKRREKAFPNTASPSMIWLIELFDIWSCSSLILKAHLPLLKLVWDLESRHLVSIMLLLPPYSNRIIPSINSLINRHWCQVVQKMLVTFMFLVFKYD